MEDVEQDGGIDENEGELLRNALEFRDLTAAEILTHRIAVQTKSPARPAAFCVLLGLLASLLLIQNLFTKSYQIVQNSLTRFP